MTIKADDYYFTGSSPFAKNSLVCLCARFEATVFCDMKSTFQSKYLYLILELELT